MSDTDRGQVSASAAEVYDAFFVPALFEQWTDVILDVADVRPGHRVLDVGCGTGVLARAAHARVGAHGHVEGLDPNDGMLSVARRAEPDIEWRPGLAEQLPYPDRSFDRTVSQFALMFTDPKAALNEMSRVTRPDGRVTVAVWDRLDNNRGYARLAALLDELFGSDAADAIRVPYQLGDEVSLLDLATGALPDPTVERHPGVARFESIEAWLHTEIRGWTLADSIDDRGFAALLDAARKRLSDLVADGRVAFAVSALVVTGSTA
ncbi:MAG TPA: methyltransferase domain-containing protein [Acidimicrobiales bacterium]|nr:methyltransferase domain-containing protein [Acidimicrobiales bacterium]